MKLTCLTFVLSCWICVKAQGAADPISETSKTTATLDQPTAPPVNETQQAVNPTSASPTQTTRSPTVPTDILTTVSKALGVSDTAYTDTTATATEIAAGGLTNSETATTAKNTAAVVTAGVTDAATTGVTGSTETEQPITTATVTTAGTEGESDTPPPDPVTSTPLPPSTTPWVPDPNCPSDLSNEECRSCKSETIEWTGLRINGNTNFDGASLNHSIPWSPWKDFFSFRQTEFLQVNLSSPHYISDVIFQSGPEADHAAHQVSLMISDNAVNWTVWGDGDITLALENNATKSVGTGFVKATYLALIVHMESSVSDYDHTFALRFQLHGCPAADNDVNDDVVLMGQQELEKLNYNLASDTDYLVHSHVTVPHGATLVLPAGARLYFDHEVKLTVMGSLQASGEAGREVVMSSASVLRYWLPDMILWKGVEVTETGVVEKMEYVRITSASSGLLQKGRQEKLEIKNCVFVNCSFAIHGEKIKNLEVQGGVFDGNVKSIGIFDANFQNIVVRGVVMKGRESFISVENFQSKNNGSISVYDSDLEDIASFLSVGTISAESNASLYVSATNIRASSPKTTFQPFIRIMQKTGAGVRIDIQDSTINLTNHQLLRHNQEDGVFIMVVRNSSLRFDRDGIHVESKRVHATFNDTSIDCLGRLRCVRLIQTAKDMTQGSSISLNGVRFRSEYPLSYTSYVDLTCTSRTPCDLQATNSSFLVAGGQVLSVSGQSHSTTTMESVNMTSTGRARALRVTCMSLLLKVLNCDLTNFTNLLSSTTTYQEESHMFGGLIMASHLFVQNNSVTVPPRKRDKVDTNSILKIVTGHVFQLGTYLVTGNSFQGDGFGLAPAISMSDTEMELVENKFDLPGFVTLLDVVSTNPDIPLLKVNASYNYWGSAKECEVKSSISTQSHQHLVWLPFYTTPEMDSSSQFVKTVLCSGQGKCLDKKCSCDAGYKGEFCSVSPPTTPKPPTLPTTEKATTTLQPTTPPSTTPPSTTTPQSSTTPKGSTIPPTAATSEKGTVVHTTGPTKSCRKASTVHIVLQLNEDFEKWSDSDKNRVEKWLDDSLQDMSAFCLVRIVRVSPGSVTLEVDVVVDGDDETLKNKDKDAAVRDYLNGELNKSQFMIVDLPVNSIALRDQCECDNGGVCGYHEGVRKCFCRPPWFGYRCQHSTIAVILPLALIIGLVLIVGVSCTVYRCRRSTHLPLSTSNGRHSRQYLNPNYEMEDSTEA